MPRRWLLLCGFITALGAFAEENIDSLISPPDSTYGRDSAVTRVNLGVSQKALSPIRQSNLVDWLQNMSGTSMPRAVVDGMFRESATTQDERSGTILIPWENSAILFLNGESSDSFLVRASLTGCPGTEVGASVAVSFATASGWSYPPIRFGPLNDHSVCPLGQGFELEIFTENEGPFVRISREGVYWGARR
jgi:hypothetical protein